MIIQATTNRHDTKRGQPHTELVDLVGATDSAHPRLLREVINPVFKPKKCAQVTNHASLLVVPETTLAWNPSGLFLRISLTGLSIAASNEHINVFSRSGKSHDKVWYIKTAADFLKSMHQFYTTLIEESVTIGTVVNLHVRLVLDIPPHIQEEHGSYMHDQIVQSVYQAEPANIEGTI